MSNNWRQAHAVLTDFIAEHSEVEIGASRVHIPESIRPEFYRLFNTVRTVLIEEKLPDLLSEARDLSKSYLKAEEEVIKLLGLESISALPSLNRFLYDPIDELIRGLFDPLLNLLKAKIGIETFEATALRNIEASFGSLYQLGYEKWIALSLVKLLEADKSFQVIFQDVSRYLLHKGAGLLKGPVPAPEESKHLPFKYGYEDAAFIVPDLIAHSTKVGRYISLRSQISRAIEAATNASENREWYPIDSVVTLGPGLTLIYVADKPEEVSLVADAERICRPDLIMECRVQKDWYEKEGLEEVKLHRDSLKPRLGTYIVSREPVSDPALLELKDNIQILTVGFDPSKLAPIIDKFLDL